MNKLTFAGVAILAGLMLISALPLTIRSPENCKHRFCLQFLRISNEIYVNLSFYFETRSRLVGELIEEQSGQFEGDILLNQHQKDAIGGFNTRNGLIDLSKRWPNKVVPVRLSLNHTKEQHDYIDKALRTLESIACIKFIWYTNETDFIGMQVGADFKFFNKMIRWQANN